MLFCFLKSGYQNNYGAYGQSNTYKQNWNNDSDSESNNSSIYLRKKLLSITLILTYQKKITEGDEDQQRLAPHTITQLRFIFKLQLKPSFLWYDN